MKTAPGIFAEQVFDGNATGLTALEQWQISQRAPGAQTSNNAIVGAPVRGSLSTTVENQELMSKHRGFGDDGPQSAWRR
jgi:hypothetical protein